MKKWPLVCPFALILLLVAACDRQAEETAPANAPSTGASSGERSAGELQTEAEKLSYALGQEIGTTLEDLKKELDLPAFYRGLEDTLAGKPPLLSPEEAEGVKLSFLERLQKERQEVLASLAEENQRAGQAFLAENKLREDVVTTDSGLQYMVLQEGGGPRPSLTDSVLVQYQGMLLDGTVFDSSYEREEPALFKVDEVIPGLTEALQLMRAGGKYRLFVPPELAYGEQGAGPEIGPNQTLIFEVELLGIQAPNGKQNGEREEEPAGPATMAAPVG